MLLVYCIMNRPMADRGILSGVKSSAVSFVDSGSLSAAVSETPTQDAAPPVSDLLAYGRVVEALHRERTVIPMRYGCFVAGAAELRRMLLEKQPHYETLLTQLDGQVEMGIRVLLPESAQTPASGEQPVTGRDYLAMLRVRHGLSQDGARQHTSLVDRFNQAFAGLHSQYRTDAGQRGGRAVVSLYYLIPEKAVGRFRDAFAREVAAGGARALISGPWPPYSFVTSDLITTRGADSSGGR